MSSIPSESVADAPTVGAPATWSTSEFFINAAQFAEMKLMAAAPAFRKILIVGNVIVMILGIVLAALGGVALATKSNTLVTLQLPQAAIALAVCIIIFAVVGGFAAYKQVRWLLGLYLVALLLLASILLGIGSALDSVRKDVDPFMAAGFCNADTNVKQSLQQYFSCCGLYAFNDSTTHYDNSTGLQVTAACPQLTYRQNFAVPLYVPCPDGVNFQNGACLAKLDSAFQKSYQTVAGFAIAFAVIMGVGLVMVWGLMTSISERAHQEAVRELKARVRELEMNTYWDANQHKEEFQPTSQAATEPERSVSASAPLRSVKVARDDEEAEERPTKRAQKISSRDRSSHPPKHSSASDSQDSEYAETSSRSHHRSSKKEKETAAQPSDDYDEEAPRSARKKSKKKRVDPELDEEL